jgi:hypothetical protein
MAPNGAGARGGPGNRTPANLLKAEEKEYEEWRMRGNCYAERLDVKRVETAEIGQEILQVLKPGDKVLIAFDPDEDPCFTKQTGGVLYADGYIPLYSQRCRCRRSEFDVFAIIRLSLYIRGPLPTYYRYVPSSDNLLNYWYYLRNKALVVAKYDGNRFDIVDDNDYDYFLATLFYTDYNYTLDIESIEGAMWHGVYSWWGYYVYNLNDERIAELGLCCDEKMYIAVALIRKGTEAKVVYYSDGKKYETVISTTQFPPAVTNRQAP